MYTKAQFLESMAHEVKVIKHLIGKIPEGSLDYRPTEKQRSTLELLQYLPHIFGTIPLNLAKQEWANAQEQMGSTKDMSVEQVSAELDRQLAQLNEFYAEYSDKDLQEKEGLLPFGVKMPLGQGLIDYPLKFASAYRMQLFLYLKSNGRTELGTPNCWFGINPEDFKM